MHRYGTQFYASCQGNATPLPIFLPYSVRTYLMTTIDITIDQIQWINFPLLPPLLVPAQSTRSLSRLPRNVLYHGCEFPSPLVVVYHHSPLGIKFSHHPRLFHADPKDNLRRPQLGMDLLGMELGLR